MDRSDGTRAERHCNARYVRGSKNASISGRSMLKRGYVSRYKYVPVCVCVRVYIFVRRVRRKGYIDVQL